MLETQLTKFLIVGGFSTVVNYAVFYSLLTFFQFGYLFASGSGFVSGVLFGYLINKSWTFEVDSSEAFFFKYLVVYLFSLSLSLAVMEVLVGYFGLAAEIANILCIVITTCTNFVGVKHVVFIDRGNLGTTDD